MYALKSRQSLKMATVIVASMLSVSAFAVAQPELDNNSYILMDYDTGIILAQKMPTNRFHLRH